MNISSLLKISNGKRSTNVKKIYTSGNQNSLGRYLAILAIVALGVGFFSGIKVTREAMIKTADEYLADHDFFDYKVVSTLGFKKKKDVKALAKESYIGSAEGSVSTDVLYSIDGEADRVLMMHSITDRVNELSLKSGRMPKADDECVVDYRLVDDDAVGQKIVISSENEKDTRKMFKYKEYTITGIVISPYYMNFERGSTSLGSGSVAGFAYIKQRRHFDTDYFTEIFLGLKDHYSIYSDEYNDLVDATEDKLQTAADKRSDLRYQKIIKDAKESCPMVKRNTMKTTTNTCQKRLMQNKNWQTAIKNHRWKEHFGPREKRIWTPRKKIKGLQG